MPPCRRPAAIQCWSTRHSLVGRSASDMIPTDLIQTCFDGACRTDQPAAAPVLRVGPVLVGRSSAAHSADVLPPRTANPRTARNPARRWLTKFRAYDLGPGAHEHAPALLPLAEQPPAARRSAPAAARRSGSSPARGRRRPGSARPGRCAASRPGPGMSSTSTTPRRGRRPPASPPAAGRAPRRTGPCRESRSCDCCRFRHAEHTRLEPLAGGVQGAGEGADNS